MLDFTMPHNGGSENTLSRYKKRSLIQIEILLYSRITSCIIIDESFSWNSLKKTKSVPVADFTVGILIFSEKSGEGLYD